MPEGTIKAGVIGHPVAHSLSPKLHGYWLEQLGIAGEYKAYDVAPENLEHFIRNEMPRSGMAGCNLTIPHKEAVIPLLDEVDDIARSIGAVNTVVIRGNRLHGTNTDTYGFRENIRASLKRRDRAVILGAGGAARAVVKAVLDEGFEEVLIVNRTRAKAETLAAQFGSRPKSAGWEQRSSLLDKASLLVNTTSLGLKGNEALEIDLSALPKDAVVTDIVYAPLLTPLLKDAGARGLATVDGLGMLMHQAAPAFEAFFGQRPQVTDGLRRFLLEA